MKKYLSVLLSLVLMLGMIPTAVFAVESEGFETVRDISGLGTAVDAVYFEGNYYAITPNSILVSSDLQHCDICYESMQYHFSSIYVFNNVLVVISDGQSYDETYGNMYFTNIITSADGENFTVHEAVLQQYKGAAFYNGKYYFSYRGSDGFYVDSTSDFKEYTSSKLFTGEYNSTPEFTSDENGLYAYSSSVSGTLLYRLNENNWELVNNNSGIVANKIKSIGGKLYGVMIKKTPRETALFCYENNAWAERYKIFDGEGASGIYFLENRVAVTAWDNNTEKQLTYLSSVLTEAETSFSILNSELFSSATYYAKEMNGSCFVFGNGELPKVSTDLVNYQSIGTELLHNAEIAAGSGVVLMATDGKLYKVLAETGELTQLNTAETIACNSVFFVNGMFYIFAFDFEDYSNKVYCSSDGIELEEKAFAFTDENGELFPLTYMDVSQFELSYGTYKLLVNSGDGNTRLFESENSVDYSECTAVYSDMPLENISSYCFSDKGSAVLTNDGYTSTLYYSADGNNYQACAIDNAAVISGIICDENGYLVYGCNEVGNAVVYTSEDGAVFEKLPADIGTGKIAQLIKADNGYYAVLHSYTQCLQPMFCLRRSGS